MKRLTTPALAGVANCGTPNAVAVMDGGGKPTAGGTHRAYRVGVTVTAGQRLGELLLRHRLATGVSQRELARSAGLSERAIRDLERGATDRPRRHSVRAIAQALGLNDAQRAVFLAAAVPAPAVDQPVTDRALPVPLLTPTGSADLLIGRADELRALTDLVLGGRHRIVTVTGPGGVGKSRLVAELVAALRERDWLPVVALDLSGLTDPSLVADVTAEALDGGGPSRLPALERAAVQLGDRRVVVVLDCFERLVAAAPFVANLVRRCSGLTVLTTSQRPLRLAGERVIRLAPLPPQHAVDLFVHRAATAVPGFRRTGDNAAALAAICRRVEHLPLAIELAAAWMRLITPAELSARLDRQLPMLTGGARDRPARHRSLRATLESSLDIVGTAARALFGWLGAFAGGGRLADLEAVATGLGRDSGWLLAALTELVDTNIARVSRERDGSRYSLPDTMRELAQEWLAAGDGTAVRAAVAQRYLDLVPQWSEDPAGPAASIVDRDADNLRAALRLAAESDAVPVTPATATALRRYYEVTGRLAEGQQALTFIGDRYPIALTYATRLARLRGDFAAAEALARRVLADDNPADGELRTAAHMQLGGLAVERRDRAAGRAHLHAALAYGNRTGDAQLMGAALNTLGALAAEFGRIDDAERLWLAALAAYRRDAPGNGDAGRAMAGQILHNLTSAALETGRYRLAVARADEAQPLLEDLRDPALPLVVSLRALALTRLGARTEAAEAARCAVELIGQSGDDRRRAALVGIRCSAALHASGDLTAARAALREALPSIATDTMRYREEAATCLEVHADLLAPGDPAGAARMLGAAVHLRRDSPRPLSPANAQEFGRTVEACRTALGPQRYRREVDRGANLTVAALADLLPAAG